MVVKSIIDEKIFGTYNIGGGNVVNTFCLYKQISNIIGQYINTTILPPLEFGHAGLNIVKSTNTGYMPQSLQHGLYNYLMKKDIK